MVLPSLPVEKPDTQTSNALLNPENQLAPCLSVFARIIQMQSPVEPPIALAKRRILLPLAKRGLNPEQHLAMFIRGALNDPYDQSEMTNLFFPGAFYDQRH